METKDRNRASGKSRQAATGAGRQAKQPASRKQPASQKQTPEARRQAQQQAQRRRAAEQRKAAEQEQLWARQHQQAVQAQQPRQSQPLPEEEVHRPAPSQERHAAPEQTGARTSGGGVRRQAKAAAGRAAADQSEVPAADKTKTVPTRRKVRKPSSNGPAVIYTQPAPFNLNRLLIQLLSITAVVLALTLGLSIFFKVEVITVSGADTYSEWAVRDASGIMEGDSLLTFSRARAGARIQAELPYVDDVRFGIKLPNTVIIDIVELEVVYAIQSTDGYWWFITSEGRVVEQTDSATANGYTQILGVEIQPPVANEMAVAEADPVTDATAATDAAGATEATEEPLGTIPVATTNAQRLQVALQILQALESNDIVGEVASVDVTDLSDMELWYGNRYQVELGDTSRLEYKIAAMQDVILQLSDYEMGVLDVSFSIWTDRVEFAPFED